MIQATRAALLQLAAERLRQPHVTEDQLRAAQAFCQGEDVMVIWPTGAGKSLCYQLAALWRCTQGYGPTLVISPLIALMDDQVHQLQALQIEAVAWHSARQVAAAPVKAWARCVLLYMSPERASASATHAALQAARVAALVVDEAHCIPMWGADFRPLYRQVGHLRQQLAVPAMALTATATPSLMTAIQSALALAQPVVLRRSPCRANLHFQVQTYARAKLRQAAWLTMLQDTGVLQQGKLLIYAATRRQVERSVVQLQAAGMAASAYHAGLSAKLRQQVLHSFRTASAGSILVATSAFGMGIDLPDIRTVLHLSAPASLEAYYQEAGRAGRDRQPAQCLLLYCHTDQQLHRRLQQRSTTPRQPAAWATLWRQLQQRQAALQAYAQSRACRQAFLLAYLQGEPWPTALGTPHDCGTCDNCHMPRPAAVHVPPPPRCDAAAQAHIVAAVGLLRRPVGARRLAQALCGSRQKDLRAHGLLNLPQHGLLKPWGEAAVRATLTELLAEGTLVGKGGKYPTLWLPGKAVRTPHRRTTPAPRSAPMALTVALRTYSRRTAQSLGWPAYRVLPKQLIATLVRHPPHDATALAATRGMGPRKLARFGSAILALVQQHTTPAAAT